MISLEEVGKSFDGGATWAVRKLSLDIGDGELLVLLGESGCGKTTTLKMINRLVEPSEGSIVVDGENLRDHDPVVLRRGIGYVFQGIGLFPHMTVAENVGLVPRLLGWDAAEIATRVEELLALVELDAAEFSPRFPGELSGGQQQRVGVARALAARPRIMLMDEPFGALDPLTRDALQKETRRLHLELGLTTVMVTHDMVEALTLADRIAVLRAGQVLQIGAPAELLTSPADDYVASLMAMPRARAELVDALLEGSS